MIATLDMAIKRRCRHEVLDQTRGLAPGKLAFDLVAAFRQVALASRTISPGGCDLARRGSGQEIKRVGELERPLGVTSVEVALLVADVHHDSVPLLDELPSLGRLELHGGGDLEEITQSNCVNGGMELIGYHSKI
jgi:hypothetical protein